MEHQLLLKGTFIKTQDTYMLDQGHSKCDIVRKYVTIVQAKQAK